MNKEQLQSFIKPNHVVCEIEYIKTDKIDRNGLPIFERQFSNCPQSYKFIEAYGTLAIVEDLDYQEPTQNNEQEITNT